MPLTVTNGLLFCRTLYVDTDTVDPAISDTELVRIFNEKYLRWHEKVEPRFQRINATTSGFDFNGVNNVTSTLTNIAEIERVYEASGISTTAPIGANAELEKADQDSVMRDLENYVGSVYPSNTQRLTYFAERVATDTEASIGKWRLWLNQTTNGHRYFVILARLVPAILTTGGGGTDQPDVSDESAYTLWRLTAAEAARAVGEDQEFIAEILSPVSDDQLSAMGMTQLASRPRAKVQLKRVA